MLDLEYCSNGCVLEDPLDKHFGVILKMLRVEPILRKELNKFNVREYAEPRSVKRRG